MRIRAFETGAVTHRVKRFKLFDARAGIVDEGKKLKTIHLAEVLTSK